MNKNNKTSKIKKFIKKPLKIIFWPLIKINSIFKKIKTIYHFAAFCSLCYVLYTIISNIIIPITFIYSKLAYLITFLPFLII